MVRSQVNNGVAMLSFENAPYHYMDEVLISMIEKAFDELHARDDVRVIVLANSQPGFFITHYSLSNIKEATSFMASLRRWKLPVEYAVRPAMALARRVHSIRNVPMLRAFYKAAKRTPLGGALVYVQVNGFVSKLRNSAKPVIAAIGGNAQGIGMEIAQACDFRIMARGPFYLSQIESLVGLVPGSGGAQHLARIIGTGKALELSMLGTRIDADTAQQFGLVYKAVEPDELMISVQTLAEQLALRTPESLQHIKRSVNLGHDRSFSEGLRIDELGFLMCSATPTALAAFAENEKSLREGKSINSTFDTLGRTDINSLPEAAKTEWTRRGGSKNEDQLLALTTTTTGATK